jgi:hypothetical protein
VIIDELHFTTLKQMARSPAHLKAAVETGWQPTRAMNLGTLIHALVLGGDFVVYEGSRRGKAWEAFEAEHGGSFIVTRKEYDEAQRAADAVREHPLAAPLLEGRKEWAWSTKMYGRKCAGRIDVAGRHTVDLKSTNDAEPGRFSRACLRMGYAAQLAWYQDARIALGEDPGEAFIIGVESKAPFAVTVLRVTPRALLEGRKMTRLWLERLAACEAADEWPGYVQSVVDLDITEDAGLIIDGEEVEAA